MYTCIHTLDLLVFHFALCSMYILPRSGELHGMDPVDRSTQIYIVVAYTVYVHIPQRRRKRQRITDNLARRPRPHRRLRMHPDRLRFQIRVQHPAKPSQSARHILYSIHGCLGGTDHLDSGSSSSFRARSRIGSVPASRWFCASNGSKTTSRVCISVPGVILCQ